MTSTTAALIQSPTQSLARTRTRIAVLSAAVSAVLVAVLVVAGLLQPAELRAFDSLTSLARVPTPPPRTVSLVLLTEDDIHRFGFPLPAAVLDALVDTLLAHAAQSIALDLFRDRIAPTGALRRGVEEGRVIVAHKLGDAAHRGVAPPDSLPPNATLGFTDVAPDAEGTVRRLLWLADDSTRTYESLAFASARHYLTSLGDSVGASAAGLPRLGRFEFHPFSTTDGGYRHVDDAGYQHLAAWQRTPATLAHVTLGQALGGQLADSAVRGRMVFVGADAPSLPDFVALPVDAGLTRPEGTPGVVVHALGASELVALAAGIVAPLRFPPDVVDYLAMIVAAVVGAYGAWRIRSALTGALAFVLALAITMAFAAAALRVGVWIPIVAPLVAFTLGAAACAASLGAHERRARAAIGHLFARHLSPQLANEIWERRDELRDGNRLKPQRLFASILFADLRGFSGRAEQMDPAVLLEWIGEVTDALTRVIMSHGGIVDDFAGDGIKADFGVPIPRTERDALRENALAAVRAALAMEQALGGLNATWERRGRPAAAMRIGIASGEVVAGNVGSTDRLKYTVVGDVVNVAARLEAIDAVPFDPAKRICRILVDGVTASLVRDDIALESLGIHRVKGRENPVAVHSVALPLPELAHATS